MILIRNRDELLRHLENLRRMAQSVGSANFDKGRQFGLTEAIEAVQAWAEFDGADSEKYGDGGEDRVAEIGGERR